MLEAIKARKNREPAGEREEENIMGGGEGMDNGQADETAPEMPMPPMKGKPVDDTILRPEVREGNAKKTEKSRQAAMSKEAKADNAEQGKRLGVKSGQMDEDPESPMFREHFEYKGTQPNGHVFEHKISGNYVHVRTD